MENSIRVLLIFLLLLSTLEAQHVKWQGDFDKAHQRALKEGKNLMVLLIKSRESQEILKSSFMNQDYIEVINKNLISLLIIKDQKSSYPIEMLYTLEYPSLFILDNKELFVCEPIRGEITPSRLSAYLERCIR
ncbi:MAG: thioredoxin family protein [Sulfurimonas sp.]|nr:thioredoxin family protein [Sulfurimonas sp.]